MTGAGKTALISYYRHSVCEEAFTKYKKAWKL